MADLKKLTLIGCILVIGYSVIKWLAPRYTEIEMQFSEPLFDGDYIVDVGLTDNPERIKIKHGKIYLVE